MAYCGPGDRLIDPLGPRTTLRGDRIPRDTGVLHAKLAI